MSASRAVFAGACLLAFTTAALADASPPIPIGVVQVLTGPQSKYGAQADRGIELAAAEINAKGGINGRPVRLFTEDSAGNKDQAINGVRRVIGLDQVVALLGPTLSTEVFAATPIANQRGVPSVALTATAKGVAALGDYSFQMALPEAKLIPASVRYAKKKFDLHRTAILFANDDTNMREGSEIFKQQAAANGIEVAAVEAFSSKDVDFSAQLTKIANLKVDSVMISAYPDVGASILTQARRLGLNQAIHFIGGNGFNSPKLVELAGAAADGVIVSGPWSINKTDAANQAFVAAYKLKYHEDPDQFNAQGYDGMKLLAQAIGEAPEVSRTAIRDSLAKLKFNGILGPFSFGKDREPADSDGAVTFEVVSGVFKIAS